MRTSILLGRFGRLSVSLNYTWLFITVLGLWGLAFVWLPDNYPQGSTVMDWLVAVLVMGFYLLGLIVREVLRAIVAGFRQRSIVLYPFGAATPYRMNEIGTWRSIVSVFIALLFNVALGGALLFVAGGLSKIDSSAEFLAAILVPLGWLNLVVSIINLIPGIPFDGGRALTNGLFWFSGQREQGLGFTRMVGEVTSIGLVLLGSWIGLVSQNWIVALALAVIGWGAREAEEKGKELGILRTGFSEIKVRDVMEAAMPQDKVSADASVAQMVLSHRYYASDKPLAVMEDGSEIGENGDNGGSDNGEMVGVVMLSRADELLQGKWPATSVRSLMVPPSEVEAFDPDDSLAQIIETLEQTGANPAEQPAFPVIGGGKLLGSIEAGRLAAFEEAEIELDAVESPLPGTKESGFFGRLKGIVPALALIAALALLGNTAVSSDPYSLRSLKQAESDQPVTFTGTSPAPGELVAAGTLSIRAIAVSAQPVTTASLTLDGTPLEVQLTGPDTTQPIIIGTTKVSGNGSHTLNLVVADRLGRLGRTEWQFWVGVAGTPTPAPGVDTLQIVQRIPVEGALVLAGSDAKIGLVVAWGQPVTSPQIFVDGTAVPAYVETMPGVDGQYYISGAAPANTLHAGSHTIRVIMKGTAGELYATDWTFLAATPDDQNIYFKETGFFVSSDFYEYWNQHGGLDIFGYPISDRIREVDAATGEAYTAQYFQRARFEIHPSSGNKVILGALGLVAHPADPPAIAQEGAQFFPQTGHNVSAQFLAFWQARGGLEIFGYPITEAKTETNPQDGKQYTVQYFERAEFELHPELAGTPYEVQLVQLGTLVYGEK